MGYSPLMPSLRRNIITGDPILFAPDRAARPNPWGDQDDIRCPFCAGNESMTPPEIGRRGDPWRVRVFPNKYPSVAGHEVIVESPEHDARFDTIPHAAEAVETYVARYRQHAAAAFTALFSNVGARAGASIHHLHSQLMPLSFVPPRAAREAAAFSEAAECPLCPAAERHERDGLLIASDGDFARLAPSGSSHAYEQWIVPARHHPEISALSDAGVAGLAAALRDAIAAARRLSDAYNVLFMNFAGGGHFYVAVIPRLAAIAGFELSTGTFIDIIDPAAAVQALR